NDSIHLFDPDHIVQSNPAPAERETMNQPRRRETGRFTHHSSLITHHSSLITHHSSLITHHSSLITHHSSLITHHSSLITHHSSPLRISVPQSPISPVCRSGAAGGCRSQASNTFLPSSSNWFGKRFHP